MPSPDDLPPELRRLAQINAVRLDYDSFRVDVDQLVRSLEALGATPAPAAVVEDGPALSPPPPSTTAGTATGAGSDERQRARLIHRVEKTYAEYLNQALGHDRVVRLDLELEHCPGRTFRPQERILGIPDNTVTRHSARTSLLQAFDNVGGLDGDGLLVLGEPGAGKTTLLFELAQQLTERARADLHHPIPVYLPLSTWTARRQRLDDWLVDQLAELYQIPRPLAQKWTADAQLLFLLDGLDEIADRRDRTACVLAINQFNRFGRTSPLPMLVGSRPAEYDALPAQLQLDTAMNIRSLDADRVLDRLELDKRMSSAVAAVRRDPDLLDLLKSPLLVSMVTLAYADRGVSELDTISGEVGERRQQLIADYVTRRFELSQAHGRPHRRSYSPERTRAWLSALARQLSQHRQTVLLVGRLTPDWLPTRWARTAVLCAPAFLAWLIATMIIGIGDAALGHGYSGLLTGLLAAPPAALGAALGLRLQSGVDSADRLSWSWSLVKARRGAGVGVALVAVSLMALSAALMGGGPRAPLFGGLAGAMVGGLVVLLVGGLAGLRSRMVIGLVVGLACGSSFGLLYAAVAVSVEPIDVTNTVFIGVSEGIIVAVVAGLAAGLVGPPHPAERLSWSWSQVRSGLRTTVVVGLVIELIVGFVWSGLFGWFVGLVGLVGAGLVSGISSGPIPQHVTPLDGIRRSIRHGVAVCLLVAVPVGLVVGLVNYSPDGVPGAALADAMTVGSIVGLLSGMAYGLGAASQHTLLRLLLWRYRIAPLRYVSWLDHAVRLRLLYRASGGGYVFIHQIVREYFER